MLGLRHGWKPAWSPASQKELFYSTAVPNIRKAKSREELARGRGCSLGSVLPEFLLVSSQYHLRLYTTMTYGLTASMAAEMR